LPPIWRFVLADSSPSSPVLSPVTAGDTGPGAINVKLRPTPGKFRNIYAEDDIDELPPPPPPPELLSGQLISETVSSMDFDIPDDIDLSQCPGLVEITKSTPNWKKDMIEKKNQEKIEEYVKAILKEREQQAKWKNVPEWKRKILLKKEEEV
ncbi:unnamed protein product, partial [Candidula unifasciata]